MKYTRAKFGRRPTNKWSGHHGMSVPKAHARQREAPARVEYRCDGGPWSGTAITLSGDSDGNTAWLNIGGQRGRYVCGTWESA